MKKVFFCLAVLIALFACTEKDNHADAEHLTPINIESESTNAVGNNLKSQSAKTTWHDNGTTWGCWGVPKDCQPEVTVVAFTDASRFLFWFEFFMDVMGYFGWPGGYPDVSPYYPGGHPFYANPPAYNISNQAFLEDPEYFYGLFSKELVDGISDGTYSLSLSISVTENNTVGTTFFIFRDGMGDLVTVYPINLSFIERDE